MFNWGRSKKPETDIKTGRRRRESQSGIDRGLQHPNGLLTAISYQPPTSIDSIDQAVVVHPQSSTTPVFKQSQSYQLASYFGIPPLPEVVHGSPPRPSFPRHRSISPVYRDADSASMDGSPSSDTLFSRESALLDVVLVPDDVLPRFAFQKIVMHEGSYLAYISGEGIGHTNIYWVSGEAQRMFKPCALVSNPVSILLHPTKPVILYTEGSLRIPGQGPFMQTIVALDVKANRVVSVTPYPNTYLRSFCWVDDTTILIGIGSNVQQGCEFCLLNVLEGSPMRKTGTRSIYGKKLVGVSCTRDANWVAYEAHNPSYPGVITVPPAKGMIDPNQPQLVLAALRSGVHSCKVILPVAWCLSSRGEAATSVSTLVWVTSVSKSAVKVHISDPNVYGDSVALRDLREMILPEASVAAGCAFVQTLEKLGLVVVLCCNSLHILDLDRASLIHSLRLHGDFVNDYRPSQAYGPRSRYRAGDSRRSRYRSPSEYGQGNGSGVEISINEYEIMPPFMQIEKSQALPQGPDLASVSSSGKLLIGLTATNSSGYAPSRRRNSGEYNRLYYHVNIKEEVLVPYVRQHFPHDHALAMNIAGRGNLPGAEDLWIRSYPN